MPYIKTSSVVVASFLISSQVTPFAVALLVSKVDDKANARAVRVVLQSSGFLLGLDCVPIYMRVGLSEWSLCRGVSIGMGIGHYQQLRFQSGSNLM